MNDSTPFEKNTTRILDLKKKLAHPSKDALFFLQMFARTYEPQMVVSVA